MGVGSDGVLRMSSGKKDPIKIYEDPKASSTPEKKEIKSRDEKKGIKDCEVQATVNMKGEESQVEEADTAQAKAEEFMYQGEHPPEYWKELAEKTREALEASLLENEELHPSLGLVEEEKSALIQERDELKEMAKQAEELAKIVKGLVTDDDDEGNEESDSDEEEED